LMWRIVQMLCVVLPVVTAGCGSVVREEPDGGTDAPEFAEAGDVPADVPVDLPVGDVPVTDGEPPPDGVDAAETTDVEPECREASDCDDGEPCNGDETCEHGLCVSGTPPSDGTPCTRDSVAGLCRAGLCAPVTCPDGHVDPGEECDDGGSVPGDGCEPDCRFTCDTDSECADDNPCTVDRCRGNDAGKICTHPAVSDGTACDDGNPCTVGDTCHGGSCTPNGRMSCDDSDPCTADRCDPSESSGTPAYPCVHDSLPRCYVDSDEDGYGDPTARFVCAAECPEGRVANDDDCCDLRNDVRPNHTTYESGSYRCGDLAFPSYDWNCDRREEQQWATFAAGECRFDETLHHCVGITPGWCTSGMVGPVGARPCGTIPGCGETGGYVEGCTGFTAPSLDGGTFEADARWDGGIDAADGGSVACVPDIRPRVQACR